jgi:3-deoxy-D-manno-octulosonic-acid transferase
LRAVGCHPGVVRVVGSLKFDAAKIEEHRRLDVRAILHQLGVPPDALTLVAGSTHDGEEVILADMVQRLRTKFPKLFLILVPRHFERARDVGRRLRERNVPFVYRNEIISATQFREGEVECLLVNTTGELRFFYEAASVVFVGKSLTAMGGQNPIEPGALGKAMVFGPNMQNFSDITRTFLKKNAAVQVNSPEALEKTVAELFADGNRRADLGRNALEVVAENLGAIDRTVEMILPSLKSRGIYLAPKK